MWSLVAGRARVKCFCSENIIISLSCASSELYILCGSLAAHTPQFLWRYIRSIVKPARSVFDKLLDSVVNEIISGTNLESLSFSFYFVAYILYPCPQGAELVCGVASI